MNIIFMLIVPILLFGSIIVGVVLALTTKPKKENGEKKKMSSQNKILLIVGSILIGIFVLFIGFKFISEVLGIKIQLGSFDKTPYQTAICSDNDNAVIMLNGNNKETYVESKTHSNNTYFSDSLCNLEKKIAYSYDKNASVYCGKQDFSASYNRKDTLSDIILDYEEDDYSCFIYGSDELENTNKIVGKWCGKEIIDYEYTFYSDGTMDMKFGSSFKEGYYTFDGNYISYATMWNDHYASLLEDSYEYDEASDTIKKGNYIYNRCD